jgi:hypothetical protein
MDKGIDDCDNAIEEIYSKRVNNVVTTNKDTFLAGPVGKFLQDQVTELNKNLQITRISDAWQYFDTVYTIRYMDIWQYGNIIDLRLAINNPDGVFPQGRVSIGTLKKYAPLNGLVTPISASVNVDSFLTRVANLLIFDGLLTVDNHSNNDVKEFTIRIMYLTNDI